MFIVQGVTFHSCDWLTLLPKLNVKQHRWLENSYAFRVGGVLFLAFISEAFFGLKNASILFFGRAKNIVANVGFLPR